MASCEQHLLVGVDRVITVAMYFELRSRQESSVVMLNVNDERSFCLLR